MGSHDIPEHSRTRPRRSERGCCYEVLRSATVWWTVVEGKMPLPDLEGVERLWLGGLVWGTPDADKGDILAKDATT